MSVHKVCANTPEVMVLDNRGLAIRQLSYYRSTASVDATEHILRVLYDERGGAQSSVDARFFGGRTLNFQYHSSLSGQALHTESIDAGDSWVLIDIEGRPVWQRDARGTEQRFDYDVLGRPKAREETLAGGPTRVCERWRYCDDPAIAVDERDGRNLRGQLLQHYDPAGRCDFSAQGYSLQGRPLLEERRLLRPDTEVDWAGGLHRSWESMLEIDSYTTAWRADVNDQPLWQCDARGHQQHYGYDVAGRLKTCAVTLAGASHATEVLTELRYSAAGQRLSETAGNGVVTTYGYEPQTQRLVSVQARKAVGPVLQDLHYQYDPVGNITAIADGAVLPHYFNNSKTDGSKTYTYDSLYQLIAASGRENATTGDGIDAPEVVNTAHYVRYTRHYAYDVGGNLTMIRHQGAANYTRSLTVSSRSNHAVRSGSGLTADDVRSLFDGCGNQQTLDTGQALSWNGLNQLQRVTLIARGGGTLDGESYVYNGDGMRVRKIQQAQAKGVIPCQEVIYLPGLELRMNGPQGGPSEQLEVICVGAAGCNQVRVLHWVCGKPGGIENDQYRYSMDEHLGSSLLELTQEGNVLTREEYYPYGGTAVRSAKSESGVKYKYVRYSGKERDASGLYYYGYRYYQPWLGRWLSADPAKVVDGLNVYRMCRNNPVRFRDSLGMNAEENIKRNFKEGDLIYGLSGPRGPYISNIYPDYYQRQEQDRPAVVIDVYNNSIATEITKANLKILPNLISKIPSPGGKVTSEFKKQMKKIRIPEGIETLSAESIGGSKGHHWEEYFSIGHDKNNFNINSVYSHTINNYGKYDWHELMFSGSYLSNKLLWKRGSKLGIEMAARSDDMKIHFILDEINMESVVLKEGGLKEGRSITASELRYAFRNKERLNGKLHFYRDGKEAQAPWEASSKLWDRYMPKGRIKSITKPRGNIFNQCLGRRSLK